MPTSSARGLDGERGQKAREKPDHDNDLHRTPPRLLNMRPIKDVAADMKLDEGAKPPSQADHGAALMVKMNHCCRRQIVALVSGISDIAYSSRRRHDMRETPVEVADLFDDSGEESLIEALDT